MIKAIIFDYYDTILLSNWNNYLIRNQISYNDPRIIELNNLNDSNRITTDEWYRRVSEVVGVPTESLKENNVKVLNKPLLNYIHKELLGHYKLAILSNISSLSSITKHLSTKELAMFDYIGMSWKTGFLKPDKRAFLDITEHLSSDANECIFVDDRPQYCAAAEKLGMKGILYKDFDDFYKQITNILEEK